MSFKKYLVFLFYTSFYTLPNNTFSAEQNTTLQKDSVNTVNSQPIQANSLKISGYLQVNAEKTENQSGFYPNSYNPNDEAIQERIKIRRSRIKFKYGDSLSNLVLQGDFTNLGFTLKDAYISITDPWTKIVNLKAGVFNRPNYEVEYTSSQRESPERSSITRALYPDERDLGFMITTSPNNSFTLQLAGFNNSYRGTFKQTNGPDFNSEPLYFMGRVTKTFQDKEIGLNINLGGHLRYGKFVTPKNATYVFNSQQVIPLIKRYNLYESNELAHSKEEFKELNILEPNTKLNRAWYGLETQINWDFLGGIKLNAEYIWGQDVDNFSLSDTLSIVSLAVKTNPNNPNISDTSYIFNKNNGYVRTRNFNGFYIMLCKNINKEFQIAVKYDEYNINSGTDKSLINTEKELSLHTLGFGIHNLSFTNVRLTLWYDINRTSLSNNSIEPDPNKAIKKLMPTHQPNNLLTFRVQYKF